MIRVKMNGEEKIYFVEILKGFSSIEMVGFYSFLQYSFRETFSLHDVKNVRRPHFHFFFPGNYVYTKPFRGLSKY